MTKTRPATMSAAEIPAPAGHRKRCARRARVLNSAGLLIFSFSLCCSLTGRSSTGKR